MALADVRRDGDIVYLAIDDYNDVGSIEEKSVKTEDSVRLVPVHAKLIELRLLAYREALLALSHTQLFPDLKENSLCERTKEASQRVNRFMGRHVSTDSPLVLHSLS